MFSSAASAEPYPGHKRSKTVANASSDSDSEKPKTVSSSTSSNTGYVSIEVGQSKTDDSGFDDDSSLRLTLGNHFNPQAAFEFSYIKLGEFDATDETLQFLSFEIGDTVNSASVDVTGFELALAGVAPLTDKLGFYGRVGLFLWEADFSVDTASSGNFSFDDDGNDLNLSVGLQYTFQEKLTLKLGHAITNVSDEDISNTYAGLAIRF